MDWRIVLVLVIAGAAGVGFIVVGIMLNSRGKKLRKAQQDTERQTRLLETASDKIAQLESRIILEGLDNDEAVDLLHAGIADLDDS